MKRGRIDFGPWFIMIAVLLLIGILGLQLFRTVTVQKQNIYANDFTFAEAHEQSTQVEYYAKEAGKVVARRALATLYTNGGLYDTDKCGSIGDYIKWNTPNESCTTNPYQAYRTYLSTEMSSRMHVYEQWSNINGAAVTYEFFVNQSTIAGIALEPVRIPFFKRGEVIETELFNVITIDEHVGARARIGETYVNPSFSFPFTSNIDEFVKLQELTGFIDRLCKHKPNITSCVQVQVNVSRSQGLNVTMQPWTDNYYLLTTTMHPPHAPNVDYPPVRIAWYVAPPVIMQPAVNVTPQNGTTT